MDLQQRETVEKQLAELRERVAGLEADLEVSGPRWQAREFYTAYYATTGFMLGIFGAAASLLLNIIGSVLVGQQPLKLIQVYLTFPLGDKALTEDFMQNGGLVLAIGCCLYLGTGMLLGILYQLVQAWFDRERGWRTLLARLVLVSGLGVAVWLINFYGILSWLQPAVVGGQARIVDLVPWYVGLATHLVYSWTMAFVYPLGEYHPYRLPTEKT